MDEIGLINIASCDGIHIGMLVYSLDFDVANVRFEGCAHVVLDVGG